MGLKLEKIFKKILLDEEIFNNFLNLENSIEICDFLEESSKFEFDNKEDFWENLYNFLVNYSNKSEVTSKVLNEKELCEIAGGRSSNIINRSVAVMSSLAILGTMYMPVTNNNFNNNTKAHGIKFFNKQKSSEITIKAPWEYKQVIDIMYETTYWRDKIPYNSINIEAFREKWISTSCEKLWKKTLKYEDSNPYKGIINESTNVLIYNICRLVQLVGGVISSGSKVTALWDAIHQKLVSPTGEESGEVGFATVVIIAWAHSILEDSSNIGISFSDLLDNDEFKNNINKYFKKFEVAYPDNNSGKVSRRIMDPYEYFKKMCSTELKFKEFVNNAKFGGKVGLGILGIVGTLVLCNKYGLASKASNILTKHKNIIYNYFTNKDPVLLKNSLREILDQRVMFQEKAKENFMSKFTSEYDNTGNNETSSRVTFAELYGDSQNVGKREFGESLAYVLRKSSDYIDFSVNFPPEITVTRKNEKSEISEKLTPADTLFDYNSSIVQKILKNDFPVLIFDNIEKLKDLDKSNSILNRIQSAKKTGQLLVYNSEKQARESIPIADTAFILINNSAQNYFSDAIKFDDFTEEEYKSILTTKLQELILNYLEKYNINLKISLDIIESNTKKILNLNEKIGTQAVDKIIKNLKKHLLEYLSRNPQLTKSQLEKNIIVSYNSEIGEFDIK